MIKLQVMVVHVVGVEVLSSDTMRRRLEFAKASFKGEEASSSGGSLPWADRLSRSLVPEGV